MIEGVSECVVSAPVSVSVCVLRACACMRARVCVYVLVRAHLEGGAHHHGLVVGVVVRVSEVVGVLPLHVGAAVEAQAGACGDEPRRRQHTAEDAQRNHCVALYRSSRELVGPL